MKKKQKLYEDEPWPVQLMGGSYGGFSPVPKDDKRITRIVGFVRPKQKKKRKKKNED